MIVIEPRSIEFSDSWQEEDASARWRSASGHSPSTGAKSSGSSILEVEPGHRLPPHTDSAEETIVILDGVAGVTVGEEQRELSAGGLAVVLKLVSHEVRNAGGGLLRFVALYAEPDVLTTYERVVQPDGSAERHTVS